MKPRHAFAEGMAEKPSSSDLFTSSFHPDPVLSSSLRARLCSHESAAKVRPTGPSLLAPGDEIYLRLRACFAGPSSLDFPGAKQSIGGENNGLAQLRGDFADAGLDFYMTVAEELLQANVSIQAQIKCMCDTSSAALSEAQALYSNFAYPLSATLCHASTLPSATIASHLLSLYGQLPAALMELQTLQQEWETCILKEQGAWVELNSGSKQRHWLQSEEKAVEEEIERFKAEAQCILEQNEEALNEIDAEFRELVHGEVLKVTQNMNLD